MFNENLLHKFQYILQRDQLDEPTRADLWSLILQTTSLCPEAYQAEILPYLSSFPHHFEHGSLSMFERFDDLETAAQILPCARFHLVLDRGPRGKNLSALLNSPAAANVHRLTLTGAAMTPTLLRKLVNSAALVNLKSLDLVHNEIGAQGARALSDGPLFGQLEELLLFKCYVCDAGLEGMLSYPGSWQLSTLDLRSNEIGDMGIEKLAASPQVARLRHLLLDYNAFKVRGQRALANSPHLDETIKKPYVEAIKRHDSIVWN